MLKWLAMPDHAGLEHSSHIGKNLEIDFMPEVATNIIEQLTFQTPLGVLVFMAVIFGAAILSVATASIVSLFVLKVYSWGRQLLLEREVESKAQKGNP